MFRYDDAGLGIRAGRNARKIDDNNTINLQERGMLCQLRESLEKR